MCFRRLRFFLRGMGKRDWCADHGDEHINPWTGNTFSVRYHKILEGRKKLPCWDAREDTI